MITYHSHAAAHLPEGLARVDVLAEESLPRAWASRWRDDPAQVVAVTPDGATISAAELEERSARVAGRFERAGLQPGDRIVISAAASIELLVAYVAAHRFGLVTVPMNTGYGAREIRHIVRNTAPRAAVVDDAERGRLVGAASTGPMIVTGCAVDIPDGLPSGLDQSTRDTPALIGHTSGTTGAPKGAVLTSGNLLASAEAVRIAWRWSPDDRLVLALPLFHMHGLGMGVNGTLVSGATALLLPRFRPAAAAEAIDRDRATLFFGVPTMYHRLASDGRLTALRRLRLCVSGSAPLAPELYERIHAASGQRVLERYGMTETVITVSNPYEGSRKPGTVGLPLPNVELRLAGSATGAGEIQLRGPSVFLGYHGDAAATAEVFTSDGWFRTGDLGELDEDGYLRIVGRSRELIISGGYNVYPREVEELLLSHPSVQEAAVVGHPSEEWGEAVVAYIVCAGAPDAQALLDYAAQRLAFYKRPREIRFVAELPRNALGKVQRDQLIRDRHRIPSKES
jgi:malonyl-CoA/methylmalonyl-CoA synthetase